MNEKFMEIAIQQAIKAQEKGEVPIGAVIVHKQKVIAKAGNQTINDCDPTAHAEIIVLRKAAKIMENPRLTECDIYVTLEPCAMCAGAIAHARIKNLYYGADDKKGGGVDNGVKFFKSPTCMHKIKVEGGIKQEESAKLLKEFFKKRR